MRTLSENIARNNAAWDLSRQALISKGQNIPVNTPVEQYADKIKAIEGGVSRRSDINFIDYDGTIVAAYTVAEALALTQLPPAPTHEKLIFQDWNWSLSDIQALGRAVNVGAMYTTVSGKSEFDLTLTIVTGLSVTMRIYNLESGATIAVDWGDGTSEDAITTTSGTKIFTHLYATVGNYTTKVDSTGSYTIYGSSAEPRNMFSLNPSFICTKVRLGDRCLGIDASAFYACRSLTNISIPNSISSILANVFQNCYGLINAAIPNRMTTININTFSQCYRLANISIPNNVTYIGASAFYACRSLTNISIPNSITSISTAVFSGCSSIKKYIMLRSTPPSISATDTFADINAICIIEVPIGSLSAYQTATNWAAFANHMREVEL